MLFWDLRSPQWPQHRLKNFPNIRGDYSMAFCSRVNTVGEIQLWFSPNSLQEKWDEARLMFLGKLGKESSEPVEVFVSPVWWNEHSGDNQLHTRILRPSSRQN